MDLNLSPDRIKKSLEYWLLYSDMYETLVSKVINKAKEAQERVEQKGLDGDEEATHNYRHSERH